MPDTSTNSQDNQNQSNADPNNANANQNNTGAVSQSKSIVLGCDSNQDDEACQNAVKGVLEQAGYQVEALPIGPNDFANYSYGYDGKDPKGKIGVYLMAASLISYLDAADAGFDFNVLGIRGDVTGWTDEEWKSKPVPQDHDGNYSHPRYDECAGKTYPQLNELYQGRCVAVPGENCQSLGQNILAAIQGQGFTGGGASTVSSSGGAQIKDKTFEHCIRRICAATDSIFIVDNNVAILFPYTDWMAFTLRQKIDTITKDEIDPDVFTMEYNNDGFYNKVSIAWGGMTLPERFQENDDGKMEQFKHSNFTINDIVKKMNTTNFKVPDFAKIASEASNTLETLTNTASSVLTNATSSTTTDTNTKTTTSTKKKEKTTQEMSVDENGATILSEQYDALVDKYGVLEKRVESKAPDLETAQYIVNALLIQYVRDFNNSCLCRVLTRKKYNGGTFHAVQNPFTDDTELFYLNGYNLRLQKSEPLYHDLEFKYGPASAEELADYQTFGGGTGSAATGTTSGPTGSEESIWKDAAKCKWAQDQEDCSTNDPDVAKKHYDEYTAKGQEVHFDCFGMSAYLYGRFNNEAKIPCQVVGDDSHKVVMLDRGNGFVSTADEYRNYNLDHDFKWRENQNTTVLLPAPTSVSSTGGNTSNNQSPTNQNNNNNNNSNNGGN